MEERVKNEKNQKSTTIGGIGSRSELVKVIVRCRPLNEKEINDGHVSVVKVDRSKGEIEVARPLNSVCQTQKFERKCFQLDAVYDCNVSQLELYNDAFKPLVNSVLEGFNGTVFAYGQTGTGKTYTMEGVRASKDLKGVIPQAFNQIFDHIANTPEKRYLVRATYLEIYQEEVKDLLSQSRGSNCTLREQNGVCIKGLSSYFCTSFAEINDVMTKGNKNRSVGSTNMNEHSSRSHAIFTITIEVCERWKDGREHIKMGKLNLVDLAGSERQGKAGTSGERLREATKINLSLSALGNVISSLVDGSTHIPYRNSKLTRLLQDSLGGNSRTVMVATIGPASYNCDETMNTLRYACRAKRITNKPRINEDPKDAILREYQVEIERLKNLLSAKRQGKENNTARVNNNVHQGGGIINKLCDKEKTLRENQKLLQKIREDEEKRLGDLIPLLESYGLDPNDDPGAIMTELERRRDTLLKDDGMVKEERDKIIKKLEETSRHIRHTQEECEHLIERIEWLESKLLNTSISAEETEEKEKLLQQRHEEIKVQEEKEKALREQLKAKKLSTVELENSLLEYKEKVDRKTIKLKKFRRMIRKNESHIESIKAEYDTQVNDTERMLKEITKELKMRKKMVDNFVPPGQRKRIESRVRYDSEQDKYYTLLEELKPMKRPEYTRSNDFRVYTEAGAKLSPMKQVYYSTENVLQLSMEIPEWQKKTFVPETVDPRIKALMDSALEDIKEPLLINCEKLKKIPIPDRRKTSLFYALGQDTLLRKIELAKNSELNPSVLYEDFALAENCLGEDSNTECRVRILDSSVSHLRDRRPTRQDLYAMPLFAGPIPAFSQQGPQDEEEEEEEEEDYFEDSNLESNAEEEIDELMESLNSLEKMNKMSLTGSEEQGSGSRKSRVASSLDALTGQDQDGRRRTTHVRNTSRTSASMGSLPNASGQVDGGDYNGGENEEEESQSPRYSHYGYPLEEGYENPPTGTAARPKSHRLRPSSATLSFNLNSKSKERQESLNDDPTKEGASNHSTSPLKRIARLSSQIAGDQLRSLPKRINKRSSKRDRKSPMAMEVYEQYRHKNKKPVDPQTRKSCNNAIVCSDNYNSSDDQCFGGRSDVEDNYLQNLCGSSSENRY